MNFFPFRILEYPKHQKIAIFQVPSRTDFYSKFQSSIHLEIKWFWLWLSLAIGSLAAENWNYQRVI